MTSKHGKAPWRIVDRDPRDGLSMPPYIEDADGNTVCHFGGGAVWYQKAKEHAAAIVWVPAMLQVIRRIVRDFPDITPADFIEQARHIHEGIGILSKGGA